MPMRVEGDWTPRQVVGGLGDMTIEHQLPSAKVRRVVVVVVGEPEVVAIVTLNRRKRQPGNPLRALRSVSQWDNLEGVCQSM